MPFLNGCLEIQPHTPGDIPVSVPSPDDCVKLRALIEPGYRCFFKLVLPDALEDVVTRAFTAAFTEEACLMLLLAASRLREMILTASCCLAIPASPALIFWLEVHIGQLVFYPQTWAYRNVRVISKPKRIDHLSGDYDFEFGAPQIIALFIYWVFRAFDLTSSEYEASNGEYYTGVCIGCYKVFTKSSIVKTHCGQRKCRKIWEKLKPVEPAADF